MATVILSSRFNALRDRISDVMDISATTVFADKFNESLADFNASWVNYSGSGETLFVESADSVYGGSFLRIGNNSGNDQQWLVHGTNIPYNPANLYRIRCTLRKTAGTGNAYVGWAGVAADGVTLVNLTGSDTHSSQHYHAVSAVNLPSTWTSYEGFTSGHGATSGTSGSSANPDAPKEMHPDVAFIRPLLLVNYSGVAGVTEIDRFEAVEIVGTRDVTYGYGQNVDPTVVVGSRANLSTANKVAAQQHEDLYVDIVRARAHQVGPNNVTIQPFPVGDFSANGPSADKVLESYFSGLETLVTSIEADRLLIDPLSQLTVNPLVTSTRLNSTSGAWNGTISHIFTATFSNTHDRQQFFNAGGEIRFSANVAYTGTQAKTLDWQSSLSDMGVISFKINQTVSNAGVGTGSNTGNTQLTGSYQLLYSKSGGITYSENEYEIYGLEVSPTQLQFRVDFADNDTGDVGSIDPQDEDVFGDFTSTIELAVPDGTVNINGTVYDTVVITETPVGNTTNAL